MKQRKPTGPGAAALVATGIGLFVIGLMTTLVEMSPALGRTLTWYGPAGPLSGKTGVGVIVWLVVWIGLHAAWKNKNIDLGRASRWAFALVAVGFLFTFPLFYQRFAP